MLWFQTPFQATIEPTPHKIQTDHTFSSFLNFVSSMYFSTPTCHAAKPKNKPTIRPMISDKISHVDKTIMPNMYLSTIILTADYHVDNFVRSFCGLSIPVTIFKLTRRIVPMPGIYFGNRFYKFTCFCPAKLKNKIGQGYLPIL